MESLKLYSRKITAQKYLKESQILCNYDIKKYFICDSYSKFLGIIKNSINPCFFEYISEIVNVPIYFDIEIYKEKNLKEFNEHVEIILNIQNIIKKKYEEQNYIIKSIILESHNNDKKSYHIIFRMFSKEENCPILFDNVKVLKTEISNINIFKDLINKKIIDTSVYREGVFRTIYSTKFSENRPFVKSHMSDDFDELDSFICNNIHDECLVIIENENENIENIENTENTENIGDIGNDTLQGDLDIIEPIQKDLTVANKTLIKKFVRKHYNYTNGNIRDIIINHENNCIIIALDDKFCHNVDREHKSNNQYIVIDSCSSKRKCHDLDCKDYKFTELKMTEYPKELNEIIKNVLKVNKQELELIDKAIKECKDYITENFDEAIEEIKFDKNEMVFRGNASQNGALIKMNGKCRVCEIEHQITTTGYCIKCIVCKSIYPKNQLIPVDDRYKNLNSFWMNYSQLVNNGTVNININNNYYSGEEDFNCDVQLDTRIFNNKELTKLYNQVLDGHKVIKISELISKLESDFKYANSEWFFFNGSIWKMDKESLKFKERIVSLSQHFNRIQSHYEHKKNAINSNSILVKNVKSLINKLYKPGFEDDIIKGAKIFYNDEDFIGKLNSKKHLLPFTNGVHDLLTNQFRLTTKEDYINLTVNYPCLLEMQSENQEVYKFLREVLPSKSVRDYVLKKMSECLNGDIPNTYFLMFIGDTGANGKSQLLNLMKLAMGEFGEKVEVTLLTRKRNNANEANSEKIKLLNKRFAFLSEPEDGEKINIGLLKELTGSEEIVARGLYQDSLSFVMEAKLFLACNELPEIKGEDTALWRRIRVIDFPSRFVDEPKEEGEYKIDRTLPSRMREDISWRQTFMKILLEYYYKDVKEPDEVKMKTNEYRQENNEFFNWMNENIIYSEKYEDYVELKSICELFLDKVKISSKTSSKYKKEIEKYIKEKIPNIQYEYKQLGYSSDLRPRGWANLKIV
jgi:P4 family phage/plasmid primase-like protien